MRAETQNCYAIHMSPNLSSVGKYERKSTPIIHRLRLWPLQMKIQCYFKNCETWTSTCGKGFEMWLTVGGGHLQ